MSRAPLVVALAFLALGCGKLAPCKPSTIFLTVSFGGQTAQATSLALRLRLGGAGPFDATVAHKPGLTQGVLEIDLPRPYVAGELVTVEIEALGNQVSLGRGTTGPTPLPRGCASLALDVAAAALPGSDLAIAAVDAATDGSADAAPGSIADLADLAGPAPDLTAAPPDMTVGIELAHVPQHFLSDGTCDLAADVSIDTSALKVDGVAVPAGCVFTTATEGGTLEVAVLAVKSFTVPVNKTVAITGTRPLVIVAATSITIDGTLDASAKMTTPGPGGGLAGVGSGAGSDGAHAGQFTDSGGGGGGFLTLGGPGGDATYNGAHASGGPGGMIYGTDLSQILPGGSSGGKMSSESCASSLPNGGGGAGGGSLQLSARVSISITNKINAGGGGGEGGCSPSVADQGGGAGGGAGGAVWIESPTVMISGGVWANGGSGGGGADRTAMAMAVGGPGEDGQMSAIAATGGTGAGKLGGVGGVGGVGTGAQAAGPAQPSSSAMTGNGGGGGGSAGRIVVRSRGPATISGSISPPAVFQQDIP